PSASTVSGANWRKRRSRRTRASSISSPAHFRASEPYERASLYASPAFMVGKQTSGSPDAQATVHETLLSRIPSVAAIPRDGVKEPYPVQWIRCRGDHRALARLDQRPELPPLPQDAGRLQLEAADLGQVPIELQDLPGLDHL